MAPRAMNGRDRVLKAAQQIIQANGFAAATVDEICGAAGLTKGAFFHHFTSKEDLGSAVVEQFWSSLCEALQSAAANEPDALKRVFRMADGIAALSKQPPLSGGCLLGSFVQELSESHPALYGQCAGYFSDWAKAVERNLREANKQRGVTPDAKELAEEFIALIEGSLILAKAHHRTDVVSRNMKHFKRYLTMLYEPNS